MNEEALEVIQSLLERNLIKQYDYDAICELLNSGEVSEEEIVYAYAPFVESSNRHR